MQLSLSQKLARLTRLAGNTPRRLGKLAEAAALALLAAGLLTGCQSAKAPAFPEGHEAPPREGATRKLGDEIVLHEGDSIRISFPGAPSLNTITPIQRDGRISLQLVGEVQAAGLTTKQLEAELLKLYGPQLQTKEVAVGVESSAFQLYVSGAVLRPGKIVSDRPLTVLQAIMEAGGFDYTKANLKAVKVIRTENGRTEHYRVNLKGVLNGDDSEQFALKPSDIIFIPERFTWF